MICKGHISETRPGQSMRPNVLSGLRSCLLGLFSFPAMLITGLLVSPFLASLDRRQGDAVLQDPDIWWHLRNAEVLLSTHRFIREDIYSFTTHGQPWIDHEWLAEIPYYIGFRLLGERGVFLVMLAAVELVIAGILLLCYRRTGDPKAAVLATLIAVFFASISFGPRTLLFGWLCFIAEMLLLEAFRKGRDYIWWLAPLFAFWINLHGSWMIGLAFFLLFVASGLMQGSWGSIEAVRWTPLQLRKLFVVGAASLAMLFANPYGWRLVTYPFDMIFRQRQMVFLTEEWHSINFQGFYGTLLFIVLALMLVLTLVRRRRWPLHDLLFALLAIYAALTHVRFLFLTGIVVCPILSEELAGALFAPYDRERDKPLLNAALMAVFCVFAVRHIPTSATLRAAAVQCFPSAALSELNRCCKQGHLFNLFEWGGYLIWNAHDTPVFLDSRADIFEYHGILADYVKATTMNDSLAIFDRYRIDSVLEPPTSAIVYLLKHTPGWRVQYEDATAALLVRTMP
jgi:hypothetical protein